VVVAVAELSAVLGSNVAELTVAVSVITLPEAAVTFRTSVSMTVVSLILAQYRYSASYCARPARCGCRAGPIADQDAVERRPRRDEVPNDYVV